MIREKIKNLKNWVNKYNKILMPLSLVFGFFVDSATLNRIDRPFENIIFILYLLLAILGILFFNIFRTELPKQKILGKLYILLPYFIQFIFGGLFSGFAVFYLRSGSIGSSWFFILILLFLMLGNEIFKKHYENFILQISIFFTGLFFYFIFAIPVLVNMMGPNIFVLSGVLSLILMSAILYVFSIFIRTEIKKSLKDIVYSLVSIFIFVNILYFGNVIPPIPLSLKTSGVYHSVEKTAVGYVTLGEDKELFFMPTVVHIKIGEPVFVFSSVFAPAQIDTNIVHHWQYLNKDTKKWESVTRINFPISGGRLSGYRGYSYKSNLKEGNWRVQVETIHGQVIGNISFQILYGDKNPELEEKVL